MAEINVIWDLDHDEDGNVMHIAENGVEKWDVEEVLNNPTRKTTSASSGRPLWLGFTSENRLLAVAFEWVSDDEVYVVTAYEPSE